MEAEIIIFSEIVEANGRTIRQNNLEKQHTIPVGTFVEVASEECIPYRLFVCWHGRDCDGTPVYWLGTEYALRYYSNPNRDEKLKYFFPLEGAYSDDSLKVIPNIQARD